ncbi:hypothetical protein GYH30_044161 [Glycine max]|uniref:Uncharacterized protein n=1 Tax=Glycine max TaxID=3847 RepID=A0A0R0FX48_SOYBN|nr:hypothetical protein GYH30_044161 [Glycine max]
MRTKLLKNETQIEEHLRDKKSTYLFACLPNSITLYFSLCMGALRGGLFTVVGKVRFFRLSTFISVHIRQQCSK